MARPQPLDRDPVSVAYDLDRVRADFPALQMQVYGKPLVYLDNAASAQKPVQVLDRMRHAYEREYANVHRGLHFLANAATEAFEGARESVREFLNAQSLNEIIFTRSATESINLVARSFGARFQPGDQVVLSIMEHHSNIVPWHQLRAERGIELVWVPVEEDGRFSLEAFERCLGPRTRFVALTHMSNVLGTLVPIADVCRLAHERGVPVLVDGSQGAVHLDVDVRALGCDFYVFTGHKVYGPTGIGVLYGRAAILESMPPFLGGGEMIETVTTEGVTYAPVPQRFEAGTPPIVQAIGLGAAVSYMSGLGRQAIRDHETRISAYAHRQLKSLNAIRILGETPEKGPILAFEVAGAHAHDVATLIDRSGVAVRAGTHCAMPLLQRFGVTSSCRASFGLYNTEAEVDIFVEAVAKAQKFFA